MIYILSLIHISKADEQEAEQAEVTAETAEA